MKPIHLQSEHGVSELPIDPTILRKAAVLSTEGRRRAAFINISFSDAFLELMIYYLHDWDHVCSSPPADPWVGLCTSAATHGSASALANEAGEAAKNFIFPRGRLIVPFLTVPYAEQQKMKSHTEDAGCLRTHGRLSVSGSVVSNLSISLHRVTCFVVIPRGVSN